MPGSPSTGHLAACLNAEQVVEESRDEVVVKVAVSRGSGKETMESLRIADTEDFNVRVGLPALERTAP